MAQEDWRTPQLTPEERAAQLILDRFAERPPVDVRRIAAEFATVKEIAFPIACDAVTLRAPRCQDRPKILINSSSSSFEPRKRFTLAHEIGHLKIPWHCGSIPCRIDEGRISVDGDHFSGEAEANRFASELLMPTAWIRGVVDEEQTIERILDRIVSEAQASHTATRIKLMKNLPPGFICVVSDATTGKIERIDEQQSSCLRLFIEPRDRVSRPRLAKVLEFHAVDGFSYTRGGQRVDWWRLDSQVPVPMTSETRQSKDILRHMAECLFETRELQNRCIHILNGYASDAHQRTPGITTASALGALRLRFGKRDLQDRFGLREMMAHPLWHEYLVAKAHELANGQTARRKVKRIREPK